MVDHRRTRRRFFRGLVPRHTLGCTLDVQRLPSPSARSRCQRPCGETLPSVWSTRHVVHRYASMTTSRGAALYVSHRHGAWHSLLEACRTRCARRRATARPPLRQSIAWRCVTGSSVAVETRIPRRPRYPARLEEAVRRGHRGAAVAAGEPSKAGSIRITVFPCTIWRSRAREAECDRGVRTMESTMGACAARGTRYYATPAAHARRHWKRSLVTLGIAPALVLVDGARHHAGGTPHPPPPLQHAVHVPSTPRTKEQL